MHLQSYFIHYDRNVMCCLYNTWLTGISTDFYYKLIEIGAKPYLAPVICEGYWQVNSQRSIFCIADPIIGHGIQSANSSKLLAASSNCSLLTEILWNLAIQLKIINHKIKFHVKFSCHMVLNSRHPSPPQDYMSHTKTFSNKRRKWSF